MVRVPFAGAPQGGEGSGMVAQDMLLRVRGRGRWG